MTNKSIKTQLASIVLAGSLLLSGCSKSPKYANSVNDNHDSWLQAVERTASIRKHSPDKLGQLEKEIFTLAGNYNPSSNAPVPLPEYNFTKQKDIVDVFLTNAHYTTKVVLDLENRLSFNKSFLTKNNKKEYIEQKAQEIENNPNFREYISTKRNGEEVDCKMLSSIAAAMHLKIEPETPIEIVTGLFFHKQHAPNGIGHQWLKVGNQIIDPAIQTKTTFENYVPLIAVEITKDDVGYVLSPKLYCTTKDMEERIK